ncbi:MAG TPA: hypothetical protein VFM98_18365, partial [Ramlibacter sp.]|uniref:hypothetical protein n=1 Tax=Ramlibacter sp. TaxID=1917967 RepID=UPI002D7EC001
APARSRLAAPSMMHKQDGLTLPKNLRLPLTLAASTLALVACGGGGGSAGDGDGGVNPPPPVLVDPDVAMRGFWAGPLTTAPDGATAASAVVMPDGTGWVVFENNTAATAVAKVSLTGEAVNATDATVTGSGFYFRLGDGVRSAISATGTASTAGTFSGTAIVGSAAATAFEWASVPGFTVQSLSIDVVGTWNGALGNAQVSWAIFSDGTLAGNGSNACSYAGTLRPATGTAVYDVSVTETCPTSQRVLSGIATLPAPKNVLRVVFTSNANAQGGLLVLAKQSA